MDYNLLDDELSKEVSVVLKKGEHILWRDAPKPYLSIALIELFIKDSYVGPLVILEMVGIIYSITFFRKLLSGEVNFNSLLWLLLIVFLVLASEIHKHLRKSKTQYTLTNYRIIFKSWSIFKSTIHELPLMHIQDARYELYKQGYGNIFLLTDEQITLKTKDFFAGRRRHHPTLELIPDCLRVWNLIREEIQKSKSPA